MKKILCLISVLIICIAIGNISFAVTLTDIKGTKYETAVNNLVDVGLVNGYEDNTYRADVAVTRSQMAKLIVIALGEEGRVSTAKNSSTLFKDMSTSHWAYGYVNVAKDLGVINGYTDGRFAPDATVSYAETITMVVRALGYEPKVAQSSESWPNNYISCAKDLGLLKNVATFNNNDGAARGDVAIVVWNMLNTGVCTVKGSNNSGLIYGQGEPMIAKLNDYIYMEDGVITNIDFDDDFENATVTVKGTNTVKLSMSDTDVFKYFGKTITILYNSRTKKIVSINAVKKYKEVTGDITNVTSKKISIDDDDYTLPSKSCIFLYKCDDIDDAIEATLYMDGKTVEYVIASGAKSLNVGLVTETDITVSKRDGIKMKKLGSSSASSYALIDEDDMPDKYSVIFYYIDSNNRLGITKEIDSDDADEISSLTTSKIKIGSKTYTYDSDDFVVVAVTSTTIKTLAFKNIDEDDDLVYAYVHSGKTYLIVFTDAVGSSSSKDTAYKDLQSYMKTVSAKLDKEASYSQATFVPFKNAYDAADAIKSSDSASKISSALSTLKSAYNSLKTVSSTSADGKISAKRADLRKIVDGSAATAVKNKAKYTSASYSKFNTALSAANKILSKTNTTLSSVTEAYDDLVYALDNLALAAETQEHKDAVEALNTALNRIRGLASKNDYTESSYAKFETAYNNAVSVKNNADNKTTSEINTATKNLNNAIDSLELSSDSVKAELSKLIVSCIDIIDAEEDYTPSTFNVFKSAYENAKKAVKEENVSNMQKALTVLQYAKDDLRLVDDELRSVISAVNKMKTAEHVSDALNADERTSTAKLRKIELINEAVKLDLDELITEALAIAAQPGSDEDGEIASEAGVAKRALKNGEIEDMVEAYVSLKALI